MLQRFSELCSMNGLSRGVTKAVKTAAKSLQSKRHEQEMSSLDGAVLM